MSISIIARLIVVFVIPVCTCVCVGCILVVSLTLFFDFCIHANTHWRDSDVKGIKKNAQLFSWIAENEFTVYVCCKKTIWYLRMREKRKENLLTVRIFEMWMNDKMQMRENCTRQRCEMWVKLTKMYEKCSMRNWCVCAMHITTYNLSTNYIHMGMRSYKCTCSRTQIQHAVRFKPIVEEQREREYCVCLLAVTMKLQWKKVEMTPTHNCSDIFVYKNGVVSKSQTIPTK